MLKSIYLIILIAGFSLVALPAKSEVSFKNQILIDTSKMTNQKLESILKTQGKIIEGQPGYWRVAYQEGILLIITDQANNRMRIIMPIVEKEKITEKQYSEMLEAQFDRALDVKYALYEDVLWSVFAHPLGELTTAQFKDALSQVYYAGYNFGGSYQSTDLIFGGGDDND